MTSSIVTVQSFIKSNPLWTVVKLREGRDTLSYKSNNALYLVECKQCGDQAEKPGNTITQCRRCKYSLVREGDDWKVLAPFDEKDIRIAKDNMKKPPKKFTFVEEELPEKREKKVEVEEVEEEELPKKRGKKEKVVVEAGVQQNGRFWVQNPACWARSQLTESDPACWHPPSSAGTDPGELAPTQLSWHQPS